MYRQAMLLWREVQACAQRIRDLPQGQAIDLPVAGSEGMSSIFAVMKDKRGASSTPAVRMLSALDIIEGVAVFIQSRMNLHGLTHDGFMQILEKAYGATASTYADAYRIADWYLGEDLFEVFSPACFFALCTEDPGPAFCRIIEELGKSGLLRKQKRPAARDIAQVCLNGVSGGLRTGPEEINFSGKHPILFPYIMQAMELLKGKDFVEFGARPYECHETTVFDAVMPPLVRHRGGFGVQARFLPDFLGRPDGAKGNSAFLIHFTAVCGAAMAMALPGNYYMQCPHRECPHHKLRLCHAFAPIPKDYRDCGFVETFQATFEKPISQVRFL
jgi:hypothetical protein